MQLLYCHVLHCAEHVVPLVELFFGWQIDDDHQFVLMRIKKTIFWDDVCVYANSKIKLKERVSEEKGTMGTEFGGIERKKNAKG